MSSCICYAVQSLWWIKFLCKLMMPQFWIYRASAHVNFLSPRIRKSSHDEILTTSQFVINFNLRLSKQRSLLQGKRMLVEILNESCQRAILMQCKNELRQQTMQHWKGFRSSSALCKLTASLLHNIFFQLRICFLVYIVCNYSHIWSYTEMKKCRARACSFPIEMLHAM